MASLQSSLMLLSTNHKPPSTTARRFRVSCSSGGGGGVDRRDLLLGLGGLYGATAANLNARADPIQPPDMKVCGVPDVGGVPLDVNCCPPVSDAIKDYVLPPVGTLRVRPAAHSLHRHHHGYLAKYEEAVRRMRALDKSDPDDPRGFTQQANVHCAYCNNAYDQTGTSIPLSIHFSWLFFPWHRWYLYFYERILGKLIQDPTFALPFWNWDNPRGMHLPSIFDNEKSPLYNTNRNPLHRPPAVVDLQYTNDKPEPTDDERLVRSNLATMYNEMMRVRKPEDFMGQSYLAGDEVPPPAKAGTVERGSHTSIHRWVGDPSNPYHEDLGNFYSAGRDPAFYSHHSNVDRMWTIWRGLKTRVPKAINDPDYLNAAFLFYDENKELVRVRAGDALDNRKMGYEYEDVDVPWLYFRPPRRAAGVKIKDISKTAQRPEKVFPLTLSRIARVLVSKTAPGAADEDLVVEHIHASPEEFVKFDVYVNSEEDDPKDVDKAEYAGTFAKLPHRGGRGHHSHDKGKGSVRFTLKELYEDINIDGDDEEVVVTIVPRANGRHVTIGGVKIVKA
ncbi:hypothetical protein SASPL_144434 [Salvia splendens]|uniref:Tyrosinase copper-binding domain-containing protein n=1 Tax=Salvia splendens TaxID=180675 RepID=A0A8X8WFT1_SALSN|nr:polyphenol oxidase I, chloroplastic-like [Salvia splendens]KAG6393860.1 hypothetical protein SASPL_144434 [Salvia splendens]